MKYLRVYLIGITAIICFSANCQDCSLVERTSKRSAEVKSRGASFETRSFEFFMIQRHSDPNAPNDSTNFSVMLMKGTTLELTDSVTNSRGSFKFQLANGTELVIDGATADNLGDVTLYVPNTILFEAKATEKQFRTLGSSLIVRMEAFGILESDFKPKKQKQIQTVVQCLVAENQTD
ncbi:MAG: hypothetical protein AAGF85_13300 [Bacteroidota bacterium]